jgi:hypothetical protein
MGSVYIPYVKGVSEKFKRIGIRYNFRMIFKINMLLGVHSWKPGRKEICYRQHNASSVFPVNVAEATLAKQADL